MTSKYNEPHEVSFLLLGTYPDRSFLPIKYFFLYLDKRIDSESNLNCDFLDMSETCVQLNRNTLSPISMPGQNINHTTTESSQRFP